MEIDLVKRDGKVTMERSFEYICSRLRNGTYTVTVKPKHKARSVNQNSLMWLWFTCLEDNSGQPKEDWHDYYVAKFLSRPVWIGDRKVVVPGRTSTLSAEAMTDFLNKVQADAATEWGIRLPLPADRFFGEFLDEYRHRY